MTATLQQHLDFRALSSATEQVLTHTRMWERTHSRTYVQTEEELKEFRAYNDLGTLAFVNMDLEKEEPSKITVQNTKQSRFAKVHYYVEDFNDVETIKRYNELGYVNVSDVAQERGLTNKAMLSKLAFHRNRTSNNIIFVVSRFMKPTWQAIFNAIINNKTVHVRIGNKQYKAVKYLSDDFNTISDLFQYEMKQNMIAWLSQRNRENKELRTLIGTHYYNGKGFEFSQGIKQRPVTVERAIVTDTFCKLWELDQPTDELSYQVALETIQFYINARFAPTRILPIKPGSQLYLDMFANIPSVVLDWLVPLTPIDWSFQATEDADYEEESTYGNEDLLDSLGEDEDL